jgi:hypothetical protein
MVDRSRCTPSSSGRTLLLGLTLLMLAGCSAEPLEPHTGEPGGHQSGVSGGATTGTLIGTWQNVIVIEVPGDIQTWTTTWRFDAAGTCRQTVVTRSLAEGFPRTTERTCTFTTSGTTITIAYTGAGVLTFDFSLTGPASDVLVLDGFEYTRLV